MVSINIHKICGPDTSAMDIVLLHGLTGNHTDTWTSGDCGEANKYWPSWIFDDCDCVGIYAIDYDSAYFRDWANSKLNIHELATSCLELMASEGIGSRPFGFVAHSLGGLLAKEILRVAAESSDPDWNAIATNAQLVCFIGTPHHGSGIASVLNAFLPGVASAHIKLLSGESGYLAALNSAYREYAGKNGHITLAYYEKQKTKQIFVVDQSSADPGVTGTTPIGLEGDHGSMCKPASRSAMLYRSLLLRIRRIVKPFLEAKSHSGHGLTQTDYGVEEAADRRDLLTKLIDAGREHEYATANKMQNRFAMNYFREGLHPVAKGTFDAFLASVEQRFITHVFLPRICKGASTDEVAEALQAQVIDAICANAPNEWKATQASVLDALYFLTERCHIRWDAA